MSDGISAVLYLHPKSWQFLRADKIDIFPAKVSNLGRLLKKENIKDKKIAILLDDSLIHKKEISLEDPEKAQNDYEDFLKGLLIDEGNLASVKVYEGNTLSALVVDKSFYQGVQSLIKEKGAKVEAVLPGSFLEIKELSKGSLELIIQNKASFHKFNFIKETKSHLLTPPKNISGKKTKPDRKNSLFWAVLGLILLVGGGMYVNKDKLFNLKQNIPLKKQVAQVPSQNESSPSAGTQLSLREGVKIQILNASGIKGLAGKVQDKLEAVGYTNIVVDSLSQVQRGNSVVVFGPNIQADLASEIKDAVKKIDKNVEEVATKSAEFDAVVTIKR